MPAKGDARPARQSSWLGALLGAELERLRNYVRISFAGFVLIHSLVQAYRAGTSGAVPQPGLEAEPWLVAILLLAVWLPFLVFAGSELWALGQARTTELTQRPALAQQKALAKIEPLALLVVLAFVALHSAELVWPLLSDRLLAEDVRPELVALLSTTQSGLPLQAIGALCAVGAAAFYALRQMQKAFPDASPALARFLVALGVTSYLLGSYAVIRCASGSLLP